MLDRRVAWQDAMAKLLRREIALSARPPLELLWPRDERAARVASLVQENPSDHRKLDQLCRRQGVSPRTLQRLFPKETGLSFEQWRTRARILYATQLLAEGKKVGAVARRCGYQGASAFVAAFRRETGATPGRFCEGKHEAN
jgi:AraC-like DNA-binding protein